MKRRDQYANLYEYHEAKRKRYQQRALVSLLCFAALALGFWLGFQIQNV